MINKSVKYLGLDLRNPIVVSSCGLTADVESIKKIENAGAGAVVLKSLFEEQILGEVEHTANQNSEPEMESYINAYIRSNSIENYLKLIKDAKSSCTIPIIASICCRNDGDWVSFAREIQESGADALELNIFYMPSNVDISATEIEQSYLKTAQHVVENVSIPVVVKIPNHFTNPLNIVKELYFRGVKGVVMFNRFYEPDINVDKMSVSAKSVYSTPEDLNNSLRWIAMSSASLNTISYGSSTGVHKPEDVIKMLLVGASAVHVCSVLYEKGIGYISELLAYIDKWGEEHTFSNISDIVGKLNYSHNKYSEQFERAQFMKYFSQHK